MGIGWTGWKRSWTGSDSVAAVIGLPTGSVWDRPKDEAVRIATMLCEFRSRMCIYTNQNETSSGAPFIVKKGTPRLLEILDVAPCACLVGGLRPHWASNQNW